MTPKLSKSSKKKIKTSIKITETHSRGQKNEKFLENEFYVHWSPFDSKSSVLLKETRYEKWIVAR